MTSNTQLPPADAGRLDRGVGRLAPERAKQRVLTAYPKAYSARDVDGFWHIWCPTVRGALSGGQQDTRSAATAWKWAADRLPPNT